MTGDLFFSVKSYELIECKILKPIPDVEKLPGLWPLPGTERLAAQGMCGEIFTIPEFFLKN